MQQHLEQCKFHFGDTNAFIYYRNQIASLSYFQFFLKTKRIKRLHEFSCRLLHMCLKIWYNLFSVYVGTRRFSKSSEQCSTCGFQQRPTVRAAWSIKLARRKRTCRVSQFWYAQYSRLRTDTWLRVVVIAIFTGHVDTIEKCEKAATMLQGFRNYLHYHIKCSKTYLHIRMRKRVDLLLQGLRSIQCFVSWSNSICSAQPVSSWKRPSKGHEKDNHWKNICQSLICISWISFALHCVVMCCDFVSGVWLCVRSSVVAKL